MQPQIHSRHQYLLSFLLLFLWASFGFAQEHILIKRESLAPTQDTKNTNPLSHLKVNSDGLLLNSYNLEAFKQTGKVRCYSMENDAIRRAKNPSLASLGDFEVKLQALIADRKKRSKGSNERTIGDVFYVPVVVHVIHSGEAIGTASNISDAQIQDQIDVLNEDFRRKIGTPGYNTNPVGADTKIEFVLAKRKPDGTASNGIDRILRTTIAGATWSSPGFTTNIVDTKIKPATFWDPTQYMNMWTVEFGGTSASILGYAQFPDDAGIETGASGCTGTTSAQAANTDGLVMVYNGFGRNLGGFTVMAELQHTKSDTDLVYATCGEMSNLLAVMTIAQTHPFVVMLIFQTLLLAPNQHSVVM